jgi:hypothetical protein
MTERERENIQATCLATISQHDQFLLSLGFHPRAPNVEGLELIDKLVDDIPQPLFGELKWYGSVLRICDAIMDGRTGFVREKTHLKDN